jgi:penicillin-binding protein 2
MDPQNGQVYAMGSAPTYKPSLFTKPLTKASAAALFQNSGDPLENRAVQDGGPDGSTFKPITAIAALENGDWGVNEIYNDTGKYCFDKGTPQQLCLYNAGHNAYGDLNLEQAIQVSDDVFFYNLGVALQFKPSLFPNGGPLQEWARMFGIGQNPGIDLPNADIDTGTLPTPNYLKARYKEELECQNATGPFAGIDPLTHRHYPKQPGGCGISNYQDSYWTIGDNVESGVGQGDDQVSPLQLAVVYAALANGGTIVTPHIGEDIQTNNGDVQQRIDPGAKRHLKINPVYLSTILAGLRAAASQPGGTSDDVMGNFPEQVYGKTGTAVLANPKDPNNPADDQDYAWYACFVPASATRKPIVVVVWVPKGGFGDVAAAPVARQILNQWFFGKPGPYHRGVSIDT